MATLRPLIAGNWKMHGLRASLGEIAALRDAVAAGRVSHADLLICPPFTLVMAAAALCAGGALLIGGQDCDPKPSGPSTGDVSAAMLKDAGAGLVIVGHSERRTLRGDTDEIVRGKAEAAARAGLRTIICVGETRAERDRGDALRVIGRQIEGSIPEGTTAGDILLAYEPVWAIGTGVTPDPVDIATVHGFMRRHLAGVLCASADGVRLLYGGSVKGDNAAEIAAVRDVDGVLVGGASLRADDFLAVAMAYR